MDKTLYIVHWEIEAEPLILRLLVKKVTVSVLLIATKAETYNFERKCYVDDVYVE